MPHLDRPIRDCMTPLVHTISLEASLPEARAAMRRWNVRHLPVIDGTRLVGLLSERELARLEGFPMVNLDLVSTADAMAEEPYVVAPDAPLHDVVVHMSQHRLGSVIVAEGDRVVGIFTTTDALMLLATLV